MEHVFSCTQDGLVCTVHSYNTRASASRNFYIKHSKLQIQFKAFLRFGARTWNEIPTSLSEKPKTLLKAKLHEEYQTCFTIMMTIRRYLPNRQSNKKLDGQIISLAKRKNNGEQCFSCRNRTTLSHPLSFFL